MLPLEQWLKGILHDIEFNEKLTKQAKVKLDEEIERGGANRDVFLSFLSYTAHLEVWLNGLKTEAQWQLSQLQKEQ